MPRARGSSQTVERETAKKIAAARAELVKNAPPPDFSMPLDSLDMMEHVIRRFYFRAKIAERLGDRVDRRRANAAFMRAVRAAEKVARYRDAQLSAVKLDALLSETCGRHRRHFAHDVYRRPMIACWTVSNRSPYCAGLASRSGSLAMLAAMRRASSLVSRLLTSRRCGSSSK